MKHSDLQFATDLLAELEKGHDIIRIARWAHARYLDECGSLSPRLRSAMMRLIAMEEGDEFELSETEIRDLALSVTQGDHANHE